MKLYSLMPVIMACVCCTVAFIELLTWTRMKGHRYDAAFAVTCIAAALYDIGCAFQYSVDTSAQAIPWLRFEGAALLLICFSFLWYLRVRTKLVPRSLLYVIMTWLGVGAVIQFIGFGDLTWISWRPVVVRIILPLGLEMVYREVMPGPISDIWSLSGFLLFIFFFWIVFRYGRTGHRREARSLFWLFGVICIAFANDFAINVGLYSSFFLMEYAWLAVVVFIALQRSNQLIGAAEARHALEESEEKFRTFIEQSSEAILLTDEDGTVIECNKAAEELSGLRRVEAMGKPIWGVAALTAAARDRMTEERYREILKPTAKTPSLQFEDVLRRPDGTMRSFRQNLFLIRTGEGIRIGSISHDITEMKRTEQALRESEGRYRAIFESLQDVYFRTDIDGIVTLISPSVRTFDYEPARLVGNPVGIFFEKDTDREAIDARLTEQGSIAGYELKVKGPDSRLFDVSLNAHFVFDEQGNPAGTEGIMRDISDRKRVEEKVLASLQEKSVLLKEIHHRVKNNLQIISSLLYLQEDRIEEPAFKAVVRDCRNQVFSMALIHEDLYRSEDLRSIDFGKYLVNLVKRLLGVYDMSSTVSLVCEAQSISLGIDKAIPCGLIANELCTNALKYAFPEGPSPRPAELRIGLNRLEGGRVRLIMEDNGVGLPEDLDIRTVDTLGLQIVRRLVDQLHGDMGLEKADGTRFVVEFPVS